MRTQQPLRQLIALQLARRAQLRKNELTRPVRGAIPAAQAEATEDSVPRTGVTGGGLDTPWTWVSNTTRVEPVTDSAGDTFDEEVIERVVLKTASGVEFFIPTGL